MKADQFILERIPHRPPFLWIDQVLEHSATTLVAEKKIGADLELFQGHYPHFPIFPGVLLCEAVFQAGALLIAEHLRNEPLSSDAVPVLTRILGAKFKRQVRPGDTVRLEVKLKEKVGPAWFLTGKASVEQGVALKVEFACALTK